MCDVSVEHLSDQDLSYFGFRTQTGQVKQLPTRHRKAAHACGATVCRTHHRLKSNCRFHRNGNYTISSHQGILLTHQIRVNFHQFIRCSSSKF